MIVLNLMCGSRHRFEGWFASSEAFRAQCGRGLVECPVCQSVEISQLPSAPYVVRRELNVVEEGARAKHLPVPKEGTSISAGGDGNVPGTLVEIETKLAQVVQQMHNMLMTLAGQAENVGAAFAEEARRIHYEDAPKRPIKGVATADETVELLEEGILVLPVPVPPESEMH